MNELKNRGVQDILLAVVDGLKGFPEVINATFPETVVQTCIVHLIRHSMNFASWKGRKHVAKALRDVALHVTSPLVGSRFDQDDDASVGPPHGPMERLLLRGGRAGGSYVRDAPASAGV